MFPLPAPWIPHCGAYCGTTLNHGPDALWYLLYIIPYLTVIGALLLSALGTAFYINEKLP